MRDKPEKSRKRDGQVLTPGGPRAKELVHPVGPGEAVSMQEEGHAVVTSRDASLRDASRAAGMVLTPGGFRHQSMVHRVDPGDALHVTDGSVRLMNLKTRAMTEVRSVTARSGTVPALGSGWIAYAFWNNGTGQSISTFRTTWRVPPSPSTNAGQTIFLFNGIQNYGMNFGILQPVLQWGPSAAGGGAYWSVASWYVTSGGSAFYTNLLPVNAGDTITGVMTLTGQSGTAFNYTSEFQGMAGTSLPVQNIAELLWCNETLEAYGIDQCTDYPATEHTSFRSISIQTGNTTPTLSWTPVNQVTDCNQHAIVVDNSATNGQVDIYYRREKSRFEGVGILTVVNPLLLWLFKHGWEDPGWGRHEESQIAIASAIHGLAGQLKDVETREQVQTLAAREIANAARKMTPER